MYRSTAARAASAIALFLAMPAVAQGADEPAAAPDVAEQDDFDTIVVTASALGQSKFKTSYAITTIDQQELVRLAPLSTADLLGQIRGVFSESSGGEASNVYRVRGIPNEGSFQAFQEDGMPLYPESAGFFFTGDGIQRTDIMTQRYEAVIGGPAPVFATNATSIYNLVTRQGTDQLKGEARLTLGDTGLYRGEAFLSGPLGPRTYFAVGGSIATTMAIGRTAFAVTRAVKCASTSATSSNESKFVRTSSISTTAMCSTCRSRLPIRVIRAGR